jgi:hypothetical protein
MILGNSDDTDSLYKTEKQGLHTVLKIEPDAIPKSYHTR